LASRKNAPNRAQVQPSGGPKWAFGRALREFRGQAGISQERLAEAAGLDRSFVSLVERGLQSPNVVVLLKVAGVLKVPAAELIARTEGLMSETGRAEVRPYSSALLYISIFLAVTILRKTSIITKSANKFGGRPYERFGDQATTDCSGDCR